jgi:DNA-binding YbaB/EbfC family protein
MAKGLSKMMKEARKLEARLEAARDALKEMTVEGSAGGGAVKVVMNAQRDVMSVAIDPGVLEGGDADMLEDLLLSALRDAKQKSDEVAAREMAKVTGGMIPPTGL